MIVDARTVPDGTVLETDVCVMGAGAAGITLAREFIGQGFRVTILESGGIEYDEDTQSLYEGESIGIPYFPLNSARLRYFGGSTNHWGGFCCPMRDIDLEQRDWIPYSGWPVSLSELAPYYERAQKVCRIPSPEWDLAAWEQQGSYPPLALRGGRVVNRFALIVPEPILSFGKNYREEINKAENVVTYLHANVTDLETDELGSIVSLAHVTCLSGSKFSVRARIFVLALGGIENPRLLLLSNKQQPAGLGNGADLVGRFFMEHPRFDSGIIVPEGKGLKPGFYEPHRIQDSKLIGYLGLSSDTLRKERLVDVQVRLAPTYDTAYMKALTSLELSSLKEIVKSVEQGKEVHDLGKHLTNVLDDIATWKANFVPTVPIPTPKASSVLELVRARPEEVRQVISNLLGDIMYFAYSTIFDDRRVERIVVTTRIDQAPNPESRITLSSERDRLGQNKTQLDWRLSSIDMYSTHRMLEILALEFGKAGVGRLQVQIDNNYDQCPADTHGGWHHIGTTRMASDPKRGVVDGNCRVHGIGNLFIAGSSVFPTAGSGTPTLTLVSLALRLADHVKGLMQ